MFREGPPPCGPRCSSPCLGIGRDRSVGDSPTLILCCCKEGESPTLILRCSKEGDSPTLILCCSKEGESPSLLLKLPGNSA